METALKERKEAISLYYQGLSKTEICRRLGRPLPWLNRWLKRYDPDDVDASLSDHPDGPRNAPSPWSQAIHQQVLAMRRQREETAYSLVGAEAIHYELKALGSPEVPPIRTIHRWLAAADLIAPRTGEQLPHESKPVPIPEATAVNTLHQCDLKGPVYLRGSNAKYYLVVLRDRFSRRCTIDVLPSREAQEIVDFLVTSWQTIGLPDYLQLDNALEFRGSNRYPRSFGRVVRVALDLNIEVLFNPPHEPWRNGCVERHNRFLDERVLAVDCADLAALRHEVHTCQTVCNQTHRLAALDGQTPDEVCATASVRLLAPDYQRHKASSLPQAHGFVSFVRLVRRSGRITLGANDRFMVDPALAYTYVLARVNFAKRIVLIYQGKTLLKTYDYSPATVGAAVDGDSPPVACTAPNSDYGT